MSAVDGRSIEPPLPEVTERMQPFWAAARKGNLMLARCTCCGALRFPPTEICSACLSSRGFEWVPASGRGVVFSFVVVHQIYHPSFADQVPYVVADVKLEEGPHMISGLLDIGHADVHVGMAVEATFVTKNSEVALPYFRLASR